MSFIMMLLPTYNNNGMVNHCLSTGHYLPYSSPKNRGLVFGGGGRGLFIDYPPVTNELNAFEYIPIQFIEHFPVGWYLGGSSFFLSSYCIGVSNYVYLYILTGNCVIREIRCQHASSINRMPCGRKQRRVITTQALA